MLIYMYMYVVCPFQYFRDEAKNVYQGRLNSIIGPRAKHSTGALNYTTNVALDSQPQVIKFTSCLPMVGGSLRVLRLLPPLKLVAMI
jgi:hypothetical protein